MSTDRDRTTDTPPDSSDDFSSLNETTEERVRGVTEDGDDEVEDTEDLDEEDVDDDGAF